MTENTNKRIYFSISGSNNNSNLLTETHSFFNTGAMNITGTMTNP
jgi:hypothetical protein